MDIFREDLLQGRKALVTGGGSGIGEGIAAALARYGAQVAIVGRHQERLDQAAKRLGVWGTQILPLAADVRHPEQIEEVMVRVAAAFGGLDTVVNSAAGNFPAPAAQLSYNGFRTVVDIDLNGTFHVSKAALDLLRQASKASILNISATLHYGGTPMQSHVCAAKAGIEALTRTLAVEWGPWGIRVNAIAPGPIENTEGMRRLATGEMAERIRQAIPVKRLGTIEDIAQAAVYLISDAGAFVNGAIWVIDGGHILDTRFLG